MFNISKTKQFLSEARGEIKKVTWPNKQQTMSSTWVVLAVTFVLAAFLGLVDFFISKGIGFLLK